MRLCSMMLLILGSVHFARQAAAQGNAPQLYWNVINVDTNAGKIVIVQPNGHEATVSTDEHTKVQVNNRHATLAEIKTEMLVQVNPATGTATDIREIQQQTAKPSAKEPSFLYGTVAFVDTTNGTLVIIADNGVQKTIAIGSHATVLVNGKIQSLDNICTGMSLRVSPANGTAVDVRAFIPKASTPRKPSTASQCGKIVSVNEATGKIAIVDNDGITITVETDIETTFQVNSQTARLVDLKPDMYIRITPATGTADCCGVFTKTRKEKERVVNKGISAGMFIPSVQS